MLKEHEVKNEQSNKTVEKELVSRGNLPSRLYGYYGGILGGNVGGLMTKVHEEKEEKKNKIFSKNS